MTKYSYRVMMTAPCGGKQAVTFTDDRYLDFWQSGRVARTHLSSQNCYRCGGTAYHKPADYSATDVTRVEPNGDVRDVFPPYKDHTEQLELSI